LVKRNKWNDLKNNNIKAVMFKLYKILKDMQTRTESAIPLEGLKTDRLSELLTRLKNDVI